MRCPFCGNIDTQVKDSRPAEDHVAIRRRRFCPACGGRFTTYERVQLRDLVVIKSNGRREDFDRDKLERSIPIAANSWGKAKTVSQVVAVSLLIFARRLGQWSVLAHAALWIALALTIASMVIYFVQNWRPVVIQGGR